MKQLLNLILTARAAQLAARLTPHLPPEGYVLDIGSGTGHTVQSLRDTTTLAFVEADITDIHVVGAGPVRFGGTALPFADNAFNAALLIFVLQYPLDPAELLCEVRRIVRGPILVVQSTTRGRFGQVMLWVNELFWGPLAFLVARLVGLIGAAPFTLQARHYFTEDMLHRYFQEAGLAIRKLQPQQWPILPISYDMYILEAEHDRSA